MGKWAEVDCRCPNRRPLPDSDLMFQPHRNKRRLNKRERAEVAEWERTTKNMYECGHRNGAVLQFWPGNFIHVGDLIGRIFKKEHETFPIFIRAGDWRCYTDELLLIPSDEAQMWLLEIEEIQRALEGAGNLPNEKIRAFVTEFCREDPDLESSLKKLHEALADAARLCHASIETRNPIRLLW